MSPFTLRGITQACCIVGLIALQGLSQPVFLSAKKPPLGSKVSPVVVADIIAGPAGENQIWDFTTVPEVSPDTNFFITLLPPDSTPYADLFPKANTVVRLTEGNSVSYDFSTWNDTIWETVGKNIGDKTKPPQSLSNPETMLPFPLHFGDAFSDTFVAVGDPSVGTLSKRYDGYGTLKTSFGTFTDVARVSGLNGIDSEYVWWSVDPVYPIVILNRTLPAALGNNHKKWSNGSPRGGLAGPGWRACDAGGRRLPPGEAAAGSVSFLRPAAR